MLTTILFIESIEDTRLHDIVKYIYDTYKANMYETAYGILHNHMDSEDAIHNTILKIYKHDQKFINLSKNDIATLTFIYIRNEALRIYKSNKKRNEIVSYYAEVSDDPVCEGMDDMGLLQLMIDEEKKKLLYRAVNMLDTDNREVILLKYYYSFSYAEICEVLNLSEDQLRGRIYRSKQKLRIIVKKLREEMEDDEQ